jgi:hypothetical protein
MLHIADLIRRRYPERGDAIVTRLVWASAIALAVGAGLLLLAR